MATVGYAKAPGLFNEQPFAAVGPPQWWWHDVGEHSQPAPRGLCKSKCVVVDKETVLPYMSTELQNFRAVGLSEVDFESSIFW